MALDFDVKGFVQHIQGLKPPYVCPVNQCGKIYKSFPGMKYHLYNYDHDNPDNNSPAKKPQKMHWKHRGTQRGRSPTPDIVKKSTRDALTYAEAQRLVEIDLDGNIHRINIYEPLQVIAQDEIDNCDNTEKEEKLEQKEEEKEEQKATVATTGKSKTKTDNGSKQASKNKDSQPAVPATVKLPEACYKILDNYVKPPKAPSRPNSYFRFIEKSVEELDEEIEYDMDEEDHAWLELVNDQRKKENLSQVSQGTFELLMDRFEKEAFFQSRSLGKDTGPPIDDDAVCAICMDGECQNSNVILFCDMCNLAVHQECYGVPYIPEGQWLCRRCLQSPSRAVDCCLCPNKGGAFKQTDDGRWAHVVCALWIPEVGFSNTVFLEPIDCMERIPAARWKLTCYICKQRGIGACIQCHKTNCYTAFHVTCSQQAGLYMKIEPVREMTMNGTQVSVHKTAFCDVHTPPNMDFHPMIDNGVSSDEENKNSETVTPGQVKAKSRQKMRKARKLLAEKRNAIPVVSIPTISPQKLNKIANTVALGKKNQFLDRLQSYWNLKRQSRNGVPLLRRLQSSHMTKNREYTKNDHESSELREQLKYWQRLRQDLERARLLLELIRKREKLKREQLRIQQMATEMKLTPFVMLLKHALVQLVERDRDKLFLEPVDTDEVEDYLSVIRQPMDLQTMREKAESHRYSTMEAFEADFNLIIKNCLLYNSKDSQFYRIAIKMRDQGGAVIRAAKRMAERIGFDPETGMHLEEEPSDPLILDEGDGAALTAEERKNMPLETQLRILLDRLDMANAARPNRKSRLAKQIKQEILKVRRQLALKEGMTSDGDVDTASDDDKSQAEATPARRKSRSRSKSPRKKRPVGVVSTPEPPILSPLRGRRRGSRLADLRGPSEEMESDGSVGKTEGKRRTRGAAVDTPEQVRLLRGRERRYKSESQDEETPARGRGRGGRKRPPPQAAGGSESDSEPPASKRPAGGGVVNGGGDDAMPELTPAEPIAEIPDYKESFSQYRQLNHNSESDPDTTSDTSDSVSVDDSGSESDDDDSDQSDGGDGGGKKSGEESGRVRKGVYVYNEDKSTTPGSSVKSPSSSAKPKKSRGNALGGSSSSSCNNNNSNDKQRGRAIRAIKEPDQSQKSILQYFQKGAGKKLCGSSSSSTASHGAGGGADNYDSFSRDLDLEEPMTPSDPGAGAGGGDSRRNSLCMSPVVFQQEVEDLVAVFVEIEQRYKTARDEYPVTTWCQEKLMRAFDEEDEPELTVSTGKSKSAAARIPLEPLDLVWAKCRGYPWYPSLIINPKMPKTGYFHAGVPIPVPPEEVLALAKKYPDVVFLVLFFDTKRTWQWLPRNKLEALAVDAAVDKRKLLENNKPNVRKAVRKAYEKAIVHRCRVTGEQDPVSSAVTTAATTGPTDN